MNRHYDRYLTLKYPPLYRDRYSPMTHTAMCWGFECGNGWFNLINNLSYALCADWFRAKQKYDQIKDYEGVLLYKALYNEDSAQSDRNVVITKEMIEKRKAEMDAQELLVPTAVQVKEKFGGLRFYVKGASDKQYELIDFAEQMSYSICDVCGTRGKPNNRGWISTRCKKHRKAYEND